MAVKLWLCVNCYVDCWAEGICIDTRFNKKLPIVDWVVRNDALSWSASVAPRSSCCQLLTLAEVMSPVVLVAWHSNDVVGCITKVTQGWAQLAFGWWPVVVWAHYHDITIHPSQLSLLLCAGWGVSTAKVQGCSAVGLAMAGNEVRLILLVDKRVVILWFPVPYWAHWE